MDTNILIWAAERRPIDERKTSISRDIVLGNIFGVSAQSIAEFVNASTRAKVELPVDQIERWIEFLSSMPFTVVDVDIVRRGLWLQQRYRIQYYDAALLAAAERLGAPIFYSEDLNNGQTYGSVRVVNPFL
ncbi:PIN domain-containing protein [Jiella sp. M17.18]|uniref:PIN domain-containing protein n=1 Tax=Jiella sp. M17.18 TaxID=3234247 RepID=UPI0034DE7371